MSNEWRACSAFLQIGLGIFQASHLQPNHEDGTGRARTMGGEDFESLDYYSVCTLHSNPRSGVL